MGTTGRVGTTRRTETIAEGTSTEGMGTEWMAIEYIWTDMSYPASLLSPGHVYMFIWYPEKKNQQQDMEDDDEDG